MPSLTKSHPALSISTVLSAVLLVFTMAAVVKAQDDPPPDFNKLNGQLEQAHRSGDYAKALEIATQMHELRPKDSTTVYNIACMHCLLGHKDEAYTSLEKAVKLGYRNVDHLARDDDLKTIRGEDRFRAILKQLRSGKAPAGKKTGKPEKPEKKAKPAEPEEPAEPAQPAEPKKPDAAKLSPRELQVKITALTQKLIAASNAGEQEKALEIALDALEHAKILHDKAGQQAIPLVGQCYYNVACMYSILDKKDEAFQHLDKSISAGGFTRDMVSQIEGDADFKNIRQDPRYAKAVAKAGGDASRKDDSVKFKWKVTLPEDHDGSQKAPLIVALHPHNGSMAACTKRWKKAASKMGAILLTPQGTHKGDDGEFHWGRDLDEIEGNVMDAINDALDEYKIDQDAIVLAGFSEGAWATWALAMRNPEVFRGIIPVAGRFVVESESYLEDEDLAKLRVFIMVGADDEDELVDANKEAAKRFEKIGAGVKLNVYEDVGHEFPPKAYKKQLKALRFILGK